MAAVVVGAQALALIALALADLLNLESDRVGLGLGVAVVFLFLGVGLLAAAVMLQRGRGGARGPLVVAQLISLGLAWNLRGAEGPAAGPAWLPAVLAISAGVALGCLIAPPVNAALAELAEADLSEGEADPDGHHRGSRATD